MKLAVHCANLTWPGGPAALGTDPRRGGAGRRRGWRHDADDDGPLLPDGAAGRAARADARGLHLAGLPRREDQQRRAGAAGHRRDLPAPRAARQDRHHARRAQRRAGDARDRRRLVRPRARRPGRPVPVHLRAVRAAGGGAADLSPDVERRRRPLRGQALPAGRDRLRPAAAARRRPPGADRWQRRAQDPAPGREVRRRLQPLRRRAGRGGPQDRGARPALRDRGA